jgi:hypothetical protein
VAASVDRPVAGDCSNMGVGGVCCKGEDCCGWARGNATTRAALAAEKEVESQAVGGEDREKQPQLFPVLLLGLKS